MAPRTAARLRLWRWLSEGLRFQTVPCLPIAVGGVDHYCQGPVQQKCLTGGWRTMLRHSMSRWLGWDVGRMPMRHPTRPAGPTMLWVAMEGCGWGSKASRQDLRKCHDVNDVLINGKMDPGLEDPEVDASCRNPSGHRCNKNHLRRKGRLQILLEGNYSILK